MNTYTQIPTSKTNHNGKVVISKKTCYAISEKMYYALDRGNSYE